MFSHIIKLIIRYILRFASVFIPINKKQICFEAFSGKQIACNPYYIYKGLLANNFDIQYIWIYNNKPTNNVICVKRNTLKYVYTLMSSHIYISNDDIPTYIPFRKKQIVINTWHGGGAYKRVGFALHENFITKQHYKIVNKSISYFLSSSNKFSQIISESFLIDEQKFLPIGQPRNDILFNTHEVHRLNKKVRELYNIDNNYFIVLYAPTFRTHDNPVLQSQISHKNIVQAIKERYNKECMFMVRNHHVLSSINIDSGTRLLDVSNYPYMQELLCAADMLISDYSSCIWDYSFLYRPCILFAQDLCDYKSLNNFYIPIEAWGFPIATNSEELIKIIKSFNTGEFIHRMQLHHNLLGSYENGTAVNNICRHIAKLIQQ